MSLTPKRKICFVTGARSEYGLLYWTMKEVQQDVDLEFQLIVTGTHLSPEFGSTYKTIEGDGFAIDEKIEMLLSSDTPSGITKSMGIATIGFADALQRLKPDILVLLGDRFEILPAAQAAMVARIPIAHIHGGEATEGAFDEQIRHAITKMSHLHFTAADAYKRRVIQLGEDPHRVYTVGALGLDHIKRTELYDRENFEESIHFTLGPVNFLVTYHPATLSRTPPSVPMRELMMALDYFPDAHVLFTMPNADTDGRALVSLILDYVNRYPKRTTSFESLGQKRYFSALKHVDVVIGNSSSGLIEAPLFYKPTVNLGDRQRGRLKAKSVIDCEESRNAIVQAVKKAISPAFKAELMGMESPYGGEGAAVNIKETLKKERLDNLLMKRFFDMPAGASI
jgi:UDP-hydrolysing UDP-N-acetyl-D-glucosamine 2-epimerase